MFVVFRCSFLALVLVSLTACLSNQDLDPDVGIGPEPELSLVDVQISWLAPEYRTDGEELSAGDIVAYNISYIDPIGEIQELRIDSNELIWTASLYEGEYTFALKAIDNNGLESDFSQALQCNINTQSSSCS